MDSTNPQDPRSHGAEEVATELDGLEEAGPEAPGGGQRAFLIVRQASGTRVVDVLDGAEYVVGRARDAAVVIDDTKASRRHARIWRQGPQLFVEDLGSRNGTRVNDTLLRSQHRRIGAGDVVRVADCEALVALTTSAPTPSGSTGAEAGATDADPLLAVADASMSKVLQVARRLALVDTTVLLLGETGVGKEVMAREIHQRSARARGPFVRVNCPALPESLIESELFGHERGAFTGAARTKAGLFEAANGGTLLLDEIGDFPLHLQVRLLSVLENRAVLRVGSTRELPVDVRVLCATHRDLRSEVAAGRFRQDLFYRITPFTLRIPALRERPGELLALAGLFARRTALRMGIQAPVISPDAARVLLSHAWPGNVRELKNAVEHAMVLQDAAVILPEHLPEDLRGGEAGGGMKDRVDEVERAAIVDALAAEGGNQTRAAERLGISRRALIYKMHKHAIHR